MREGSVLSLSAYLRNRTLVRRKPRVTERGACVIIARLRNEMFLLFVVNKLLRT